MIRLFIAITLTQHIRHEMLQLQGQLKHFLPGVRWVKPDGMHLTLKFIGEVDDCLTGPIADAMNKSAASFMSYKFSFSGCGVFPAVNRARVIWSAMNEGCAETINIARCLEEELVQLGLEPEKREYSPHLTLGRFRNPVDGNIVEQALRETEKFQSGKSRAESIKLFESTLTRHGAVYREIHESILN